ncbi:MAG: hypothetical protein RJA07_474 [Bacteroidota bacterium]|jgi:hypothetical protein
MEKFSFTITISANDKVEATSKMKSISVMASKLTANELEKMADVVLNQPMKMALAKKALGL